MNCRTNDILWKFISELSIQVLFFLNMFHFTHVGMCLEHSVASSDIQHIYSKQTETYGSCIFLVGTRSIVPCADLAVQTRAVEPSIFIVSINRYLHDHIYGPNTNSPPNPIRPNTTSNWKRLLFSPRHYKTRIPPKKKDIMRPSMPQIQYAKYN